MIRRAAAVVGGLLLAAVLLLPVIGAGPFTPPPPNALGILWTDYCTRVADPACALPTPTPTATATSTATPTATPSPTATPTTAPTATPSPSPSPSPTPSPASGIIGAVPASGTGPLVCPTGYVNWESRGWWTPTGQPFDQYRGIDAEICWPTAGFLAPGSTTFKLHIQLRRLHAPITFLRIGQGPDGSTNSFYQNVNLQPDAQGYGEWYVNAPTVAKNAGGWNEYRLTANVANDENGERQYQSTGLQAWTTSSSGSYRPLPWWESRGWYEGTGYVNDRHPFIPPVNPVSGTFSFPWTCTATGNGTVNYHVTYVDADTHAIPMSLPRKYAEGSGGFNGTVSIDTRALSNGVHKVLTRCDSHISSGTVSGLSQFLIRVAN